jgi:hypothetical protein
MDELGTMPNAGDPSSLDNKTVDLSVVAEGDASLFAQSGELLPGFIGGKKS